MNRISFHIKVTLKVCLHVTFFSPCPLLPLFKFSINCASSDGVNNGHNLWWAQFLSLILMAINKSLKNTFTPAKIVTCQQTLKLTLNVTTTSTKRSCLINHKIWWFTYVSIFVFLRCAHVFTLVQSVNTEPCTTQWTPTLTTSLVSTSRKSLFQVMESTQGQLFDHAHFSGGSKGVLGAYLLVQFLHIHSVFNKYFAK